VKEKRTKAKDGLNADPMKEMRDRYERAVDAERENRLLGIDDYRFVAIPGNQWDESQRKARKNRPCYEIPILRSNWRQVVNDQKKARPSIKVRPVENGDAKGAELRQGLIRNIESRSNAERAYDAGFELLTAAGFCAWRVGTEYASDDAFEQDIVIRPIVDPLSSVWFDPDAKSPDRRDAMYAFVEETLSRESFKAKYPKAKEVDFESLISVGYHKDWFGDESVRVVEYWRKIPVTKTIWLLSDGRTVDSAEVSPEQAAELIQSGVTVVRERTVNSHKVVMSVCSGAEEIDGPHDTVWDRIPIVAAYANLHFIDGKWQWCGMVRPARDPQKLANYNITTAQEALSKQHKATPVLTPTMLEGDGVKALWDRSNAVDMPYLPFTPDPRMPQGPQFLSPPPVHAQFVQLGQMSVDLVKMATGIYDASVGARSNETSGKAIMARQQEGDTATYDYQDALSFAIQSTGELILSALPKVYDTPRTIRIIGKDGAEDVAELYQDTQNGRLNDLTVGKYDVSISVGPSYDTQRMEFVDALTQMSQGNPLVASAVPDLIVGSMDFPKADEAAERLKMVLPPQIQAQLSQGKEMPPEAMAAMQQAQQAMQTAEQQAQELQQAAQQLAQERADVEAQKAELLALQKQIQSDIKVAAADMEVREARFEAKVARLGIDMANRNANDGTNDGSR